MLESLILLDVPDYADKAEAVLHEMEKSYNRILFTDNPNQPVDVNTLVKPDADIYMIVMKAWIQSCRSDRAVDILLRMKNHADIVPDNQMSYEILKYYTKAGSERAAESAERVLKLIKSWQEPQYHAYYLVARAWLKSGSTKAADKLWLLYCEMTEWNMRPDQQLSMQLIQCFTSKKELTFVRKAQTVLEDMEEYNSKYLVPTHFTMMIIACLELDEIELAMEVLTKLVLRFGQRDYQLVPMMTQLLKSWIDKGQYRKATMLVNSMQEFTDTGFLQEGVHCDVFELLKSAWESSNDPDKGFIVAQIDDIIRHLSSSETNPTTTADATTAATNDTTSGKYL